MTTSPNNRRKRLLINIDYQYRQISLAVGSIFIVVNLGIVAAMLALGPTRIGIPHLPELILMGIVELLAMGLILYLALRESHHAAGPVFVLERALRALGEGDFRQQLHLREGDHFLSVATTFNQTVSALGARLDGIRQDVADASNGDAQVLQRALDALTWFRTAGKKEG
jgi:methyl-accepting chemotaxis protein